MAVVARGSFLCSVKWIESIIGGAILVVTYFSVGVVSSFQLFVETHLIIFKIFALGNGCFLKYCTLFKTGLKTII